MSRNFELLQRLGRYNTAAAAPRIAAIRDTEVEKETVELPPPALGTQPFAIPVDAYFEGFAENISPEITALVQRVFLTPGAHAPRSVVFADVAVPGPNSVALMASEALCAFRKPSVCLVDAKVSSPTLHLAFGVSNGLGLTTALRDAEPLATVGHRLRNFDLTIIPAGPEISGWQPLLSSEHMAVRLRELTSLFTFVLIEAPPMHTSSIATAVGRSAEGVILVLEADKTRRELALKSKIELDQAGVPLLGAVMNNRDFPIPERLYSRL